MGVNRRTAEFLPDDLTPDEAESALASESVEWLYVFDASGRQIARFRGTEDEVDLSDELKARTGPLGLYGEPVLKNHQIIHNHPPRMGRIPIDSFPPSPIDLAMMVDRDLSRLVVVSGDTRYEVRRPGPDWPFDEHILASMLTEINAQLDDDPSDTSFRGSTQRQANILLQLHQMGVIHYEEMARWGGIG